MIICPGCKSTIDKITAESNRDYKKIMKKKGSKKLLQTCNNCGRRFLVAAREVKQLLVK